MSTPVLRGLDFGGTSRITNLPDGLTPQEPATVAQLNAAVEGAKWKNTVRVATQGNINLASPGATVDGIAMALNDRILVRAQTVQSENGLYIWNGASVALTRSTDANVAAELVYAITPIAEGTSAGVNYRQTTTAVNLGVSNIVWAAFSSAAPAASTTDAGIIQIADQTTADAGTDNQKAITSQTLSRSVFASKKYAATFGDGAATSFVITHNLNTRDVTAEIYRNSGNYDTVLAEVQRTTANSVTVLTDTPPSPNAFRILVRA